ncbi:uncharacterized protein LOC111794090 [Cucurbita pepo subsp. pepo]|uniref:uncharacterized protein LOC111794090 n=1 Tax=Cucurbita pepo subsp. pepo TaxID=3664 RepID=UPI000C9D49A6|nr:uncharacterized protein LOC111794090 [Cucurbita pepo subsp. pepo]
MVTSHPSLSFTARLHIFGNFCVNYYVDNPFSTNVSLQYFRDATVAVARTGFDTITMSLDNPFQATLISENSSPLGPVPKSKLCLPLFAFIPAVQDASVIRARHFNVKAECFNYILYHIPVFPDTPVYITTMVSRVTFSTASQEFMLTAEAGQCSTVGYGFEHTQYRVLLKPRLFFSSLPLITGKYIGFYGTTLSGCLMVVPTNSLLVSYLIHFLPV